MPPLTRYVRNIKTSTVVVGLHCYLIISDIMAGKPNRFTLYRVSLVTKRVKLIGRELPLGHCMNLHALPPGHPATEAALLLGWDGRL